MDVSIIICTRNRADALPDCLNSVAAAIRHACKNSDVTVELVVVDNRSTDETSDVLAKWKKDNSDISFLILREEKAGLSNARNCGISNATGKLLIFTDDDCRMKEDYIVIAQKYDQKGEKLVIRGGRIELGNPDDLLITVRTVDKIERWELTKNSARTTTFRGAISGCNMVMRRDVLNLVGCFDPKMGAGQKVAGSEDTDFYFRAYLKGCAIEYVPDMTVTHFHGRKTAEEGYKLMRNYSLGAGALYLKYIFRHFNFFRPFIWDVKNLINEIKAGENLYMPEINMSYKDVIVFNIKGMGCYLWSKIWP